MNNKPNNSKGYRRDLMKIMLTAGSVSYRGLRLLPRERVLYVRKLKQMEREGTVRIQRLGRQSAGVLEDFDNMGDKYMDSYPEYYGNYIRYGKQRASDVGRYYSKDNQSRAVKAFRHSEIIELVAGTDIHVYPDEKPKLYSDEKIPQGAFFYSDTEVKNVSGFKLKVGEKDKVIIGSRAQGILISEGGDYMIYHTDDCRLMWINSQEFQMRFCTAKVLNEKCEHRKKTQEIKECIVVGTSNKPFVDMINADDYGKFLNTENGYGATYVLPLEPESKALLSYMTRKNWQEDLKAYYLSDLNANVSGTGTVCDATDDEAKILLFCIPNITRLKKFLLSAEFDVSGRDFRVYCFDFQQEFLKEVVKGRAEVYATPFEDFRKAMSL